MSLLDSVVSSISGNTNNPEANPLVGLLGNFVAQSGGVQGLMSKFNQAGLGDAFKSWVSTGQNQPINAQQIQAALGSDQVKAMAAKIGIDPNQVSQLLAQHLPNLVDQLTPQGKIDPNANIQQTLGGMLPSLLQSFAGKLGGAPQA